MSAKVLLVPIIAVATYFMALQAQSFVRVESSDFKGDIDRLFTQSKSSQTGGSAYGEGASLPLRLIQGPFLVFRPFPWEAHGAMSAFAALEGLGLFFLAWRKRREIRALTRHWREPYVLFILLFAFEFSAIFAASTSNFGILVRQRIMLLPLFLMFLCAKLPACNGVIGVPAVQRSLPFRKRWPAPHAGRSVS